MKSTTFTPGPWEVGPFHQTVRPSGISRQGIVNGGCIICTMHGEGGDNWPDNARLIAAAPDLYAELQNIVDADWRTWDDEFASAEEFVRWAKSRARHALAKARGESMEATP